MYAVDLACFYSYLLKDRFVKTPRNKKSNDSYVLPQKSDDNFYGARHAKGCELFSASPAIKIRGVPVNLTCN
jgi:hypothetical protein